ncbi:MAG: RDD family protein [Verrucomicrobiae bacterium]|nr:RDD family protein [Verrucomicrobiae bacterium]
MHLPPIPRRQSLRARLAVRLPGWLAATAVAWALVLGGPGAAGETAPPPPSPAERPLAPEDLVPPLPPIPDPPAPPLPDVVKGLVEKGFKPGGSRSEIVRIGEPVVVAAGESVRSVVVLQNSATIEGRVENDLVLIGGSAVINGSVGGDVVAVGGRIDLGPESRVSGDATGIGGGVRMGTNAFVGGDVVGIGGVWRAPGARAGGTIQDIPLPFSVGSWWLHPETRLPRTAQATVQELVLKLRPLAIGVPWVWWVAGAFVGMYLLLALAAPGMVRGISAVVADRGATAFLMGFLALPLGALLTLMLLISGIGIVVIPFVGAAYLLAAIAGKAGLLHAFGASILRRSRPEVPVVGAVLLGSGLVMVLYLVPYVGMVSWAVLSMWALGAAWLALLDRLRRESPSPAPAALQAPAPVAPPNPSAQSLKAVVPWTSPSGPSAAPVPPSSEMPPAASPPPDSPSPEPPDSRGNAAASATRAEVSGPPAVEGVPAGAGAPPPPPPLEGSAFASPESSGPSVPEALSLPRVGLKERLIASAIDWVILIPALAWMDFDSLRWKLLAAVAYFAGLWAWRATTIGGIVLQLRVARLDGRPVDGATAIVRALGALFATLALGIGYFWSAWDSERQGWHDKIAGTVVLKVPRAQPLV